MHSPSATVDDAFRTRHTVGMTHRSSCAAPRTALAAHATPPGPFVLALVLVMSAFAGQAFSASAAGVQTATPCDGAPCWSWPLAGAVTVARDFEAPPHPYGAGHRGIDLAAPAGTSVLAVDDGVVSFVGWVVDRPVLTVTHAGGWRSSFEPVKSSLAIGDAVTRGQTIGTVADLPHGSFRALHLGARLDDEYVSPLLLLEGLEHSVLLPLP